jgi:hypothetical protein
LTIPEIIADVAQRLDRAGILYAVGGSLASSIWGQMRQTNDADIAIRLNLDAVEQLVSAFTDPYYISRSEIEEALSSSDAFRTIQILHMEEAFKIDLFLLPEGPYALSELDRALSIEILPGSVVRFCAPENIVIAKLRWFVLGNRVSDRQWNDVVQVLEVQKGRLDNEYLDRWAEHFTVRDLLELARSQTR